MLDPINNIMIIKRIVTKTITKFIPIATATYSLEHFKDDCKNMFEGEEDFISKIEYIGEDDYSPIYELYTNTENWFFYIEGTLIDTIPFDGLKDWLEKE